VHVLEVDGTDGPQVVGLREQGIGGAVRWTADGESLLVAGNLTGPLGHTSLLRLPLDGGEPVDLTASLDRNVMPGAPGYPGGLPQLVDGGETVLFCIRDRGCTHLYRVPVGGGEATPVVTGGGRNVTGLTVAGSTAIVPLTTPTSFGELVKVDLASGAETVLTQHGAALDGIELVVREDREFPISDGTTVHGWLIRQPGAQGAQPLLLDIHGGPHNAWNGAADEAHLYHQELVARGWTVLILNPRASDGYGEAFYNAGLGAWGEADAKDFLEPIDQLVADGTADAGRLAVTGYSYGGFMTCYLTSRDDRFAAAVPGGAVCDLVSMAGTSDGGHYLAKYEYGGPPYELRERYEATSPYARIDHVKTPTLLLHGGADIRCPVGQAQQWFTALRERGVPTRLVLYPEASHLFILEGRPSHRLDYNRRIVDWVEEYAARRRPSIDQAHWQRRLAELCERHHVPGAALGILRVQDGREDELVEAAFGVLNTETGVEATTDSVFQIGSITKVWTATLAMQLVDDGKLDLDAPVANVLPELRLADPEVAATVTMRHLLTHTSGIDGDVLDDTGRGDDALERYVGVLESVAMNHPLGATWSYCNSGFSLAGRVIEKLTDGTWDAALRERLIGPLGLTRTGTLPEHALLHRAAIGHVGEPPARAPVWEIPRSAGPAGVITASVADVLGFARMHLAGGRAPDGTQVLSEASTQAMTEHQADLPDKHTLGDSWGIGWIRFDWNGRRLIGHDGNTIGQAAFLRLLPDEGLAVTLLTNGGNTHDLYVDLYGEILRELAGVEMPAQLEPPAEPASADLTPHLGTYERASARLEVLQNGDGPKLRMTATGPMAELLQREPIELSLVPVEDDLYLVRPPGTLSWIAVTFYELPTGEKYLHFGARATPKVTS
jgi:CubicO group peptidase (beta-lactamase class C family)/acetyl esterase/lipase